MNLLGQGSIHTAQIQGQLTAEEPSGRVHVAHVVGAGHDIANHSNGPRGLKRRDLWALQKVCLILHVGFSSDICRYQVLSSSPLMRGFIVKAKEYGNCTLMYLRGLHYVTGIRGS